jgi:hypothetical protein
VPANDDGVKAPGKNWPHGFYKRHPQLRPRRLRPIEWARHNIHEKVALPDLVSSLLVPSSDLERGVSHPHAVHRRRLKLLLRSRSSAVFGLDWMLQHLT